MIETRSPLKDKPLPIAGQSLDKHIRNIIDDKFSMWVFDIIGAFTLIIISGVYLVIDPPRLMMFLVFVGLFILTVVIRIPQLIRLRKHIKQLALGRNGERIVAETLVELNAVVLNDIVMDNFNLDHVVIAEQGVFLIETKTRSKPSKGQADIKYDGRELDINGFRTSEPLIQAKAQARELQKLINNLTGKSLFIKPVVLFPGWFVSYKNGTANNEVVVANPKMFQKLIEKSNNTIGVTEQKVVAEALKRYIRKET